MPLLAQEAPCPETLRVLQSEDPQSVDLRLDTPCRPYEALTITYGPLVLHEEVSDLGTLTLRLPRLNGVTSLDLHGTGLTLSAVLPDGPIAMVTAVDWGDGPAWAQVHVPGARQDQLGFHPDDGAAHLDLAIGGTAPPVLIAPLTPQTCGQVFSATVLLPDRSQTLPLEMRMPDCAQAETGTVTLSLGQ